MGVLLVVAAASAQHPEVKIINADFNDPALNNGSRTKDYTFNQRLQLSLQPSFRMPRVYHARVFRESVEELLKSARLRMNKERCVWFDSKVIRAQGTSVITFLEPISESWLRPNGVTLAAQIYTIVFEAGDQPLTEFIWLKYDDLEKLYFHNAIQIRLNPGSREHVSQQVVDDVNKAVEGRKRMSEEAHQDSLKKIDKDPCWNARALKAQAVEKKSQVVFAAVFQVSGGRCSPPVAETQVPVTAEGVE